MFIDPGKVTPKWGKETAVMTIRGEFKKDSAN